ncbi:hypothetical protein PI124_g13866 [Phytophthora idaei]|nr:hypothetical protein PI125_g13261 [Phytophthora idaei]KAG3149471.1 hypothetical protein PI126_g11987 [Phytophthora idaei]KAG3241261.1 hypothetical protein PI124_g13866 [Phytophthora idaei]
MGRLEASQARQEKEERLKDAAEPSVFGSSLGIGAAMDLRALERTPPPRRTLGVSPATYLGARQPGYADAAAQLHAQAAANVEMTHVPEPPLPQHAMPPQVGQGVGVHNPAYPAPGPQYPTCARHVPAQAEHSPF